MEEVIAIEKRLVLKEGLHIRRVRATSTHRERVKLRKEEADVERTRLRRNNEDSAELAQRGNTGSKKP